MPKTKTLEFEKESAQQLCCWLKDGNNKLDRYLIFIERKSEQREQPGKEVIPRIAERVKLYKIKGISAVKIFVEEAKAEIVIK